MLLSKIQNGGACCLFSITFAVKQFLFSGEDKSYVVYRAQFSFLENVKIKKR